MRPRPILILAALLLMAVPTLAANLDTLTGEPIPADDGRGGRPGLLRPGLRRRPADVPAGEGTLVWDGTDRAGRGVASGVYHLRLTTEQAMTSRAVTLVR